MFAKTFQSACIVLALVYQLPIANAQPNPSDYGRPDRFYQPTPPLPPEFCFSYHHASTALEGAWEIGSDAPVRTPLVLERITA